MPKRPQKTRPLEGNRVVYDMTVARKDAARKQVAYHPKGRT